MKTLITEGIVLARTNFGEADRIITVLTPDQGKLRLMAKGVRKAKSKLAGGIELFSISEVSYISGKSEIGTLVSTRLQTHYGHIVENIDRVQLGYELLKVINRITEDHPDPEYFELLGNSFLSLNDSEVSLDLLKAWFSAQLIKLNGHTPNLSSDIEGNKLDPDKEYKFDIDYMGLVQNSRGNIKASHIKVLRLLFSDYSVVSLQQVGGVTQVVADIRLLVSSILRQHLPQAAHL